MWWVKGLCWLAVLRRLKELSQSLALPDCISTVLAWLVSWWNTCFKCHSHTGSHRLPTNNSELLGHRLAQVKEHSCHLEQVEIQVPLSMAARLPQGAPPEQPVGLYPSNEACTMDGIVPGHVVPMTVAISGPAAEFYAAQTVGDQRQQGQSPVSVARHGSAVAIMAPLPSSTSAATMQTGAAAAAKDASHEYAGHSDAIQHPAAAQAAAGLEDDINKPPTAAKCAQVRESLQQMQSMQHPTASLLSFLHIAATAFQQLNGGRVNSQQVQIPDVCRRHIGDAVQQLMPPAVEEYHRSYPGLPASACHYLVNLPVHTFLAPMAAYILGSKAANIRVVNMSTRDGFEHLDMLLDAELQHECCRPTVILLMAPRETREVALLLLAQGSQEPAAVPPSTCAMSQQQAQAGEATATYSSNAQPSTPFSNPRWVLFDPSGEFEVYFDALFTGPFYCSPCRSGTASTWQQQPGTSVAHVVLALVGYRTGLLNFSSPQSLANSYSIAMAPQADADFTASCLATLLAAGRVSIGLLGVRMWPDDHTTQQHSVKHSSAKVYGNGMTNSNSVKSRGRVSEMDIARGWQSSGPAAKAGQHSALEQRADSMLRAWKQAIIQVHSSAGTKQHWGSSASWVDIHDLADILHHLDGYTSADGHFFFVSCQNMAPDAACWYLSSSDISLPLYKQQHVRWMGWQQDYRSSCANPSGSHAASSSGWQYGTAATLGACSELVLHYSGSHFTLSILNHQHKVMLYFDSLGGSHCRMTAPPAFDTVVLSRRTQSCATCGPHALFVAVAYVADHQGFRGACTAPSCPAANNGGAETQSRTGAAVQGSSLTAHNSSLQVGIVDRQQGASKRKAKRKQKKRSAKQQKASDQQQAYFCSHVSDTSSSSSLSQVDFHGDVSNSAGLRHVAQHKAQKPSRMLSACDTVQLQDPLMQHAGRAAASRERQLHVALASCFEGDCGGSTNHRGAGAARRRAANHREMDALVTAAYRATAMQAGINV